MAEQFNPYRKWLGIAPEEQPPNHYRLLGINLYEADGDVIQDAADQQMSHVQRHKLGPHGARSQKLLNELSAAKLCLLKPDQKAEYDRHLREQQAARNRPAAAPNSAPASAPGQPAVSPSLPVESLSRPTVMQPVPLRPLPASGAAHDSVAAAPDYALPVTLSRAGKGRRTSSKASKASLLVGGAVAAGLAVLAMIVIMGGREKTPQTIVRATHDPPRLHPIENEKAAQQNQQSPPTKASATGQRDSADLESEATAPTEDSQPPNEPATAAEPEPETLQSSDVTDLLPLIRVGTKTATGKWLKSKKGLTLLATGLPFPRLVVPYAPPEEYQLELVIEPQPDAEVILGLVAGGKQVAAILDGWGGATSGLQRIDNQAGNENASTHRGHALVPRQSNLVLVTVRADSIKLAVGGATIIDWQGPFDRLSLAPEQQVADKRAVFVGGAGGTAYRIRSLRLITLSGQGRELTEPVLDAPAVARVETPQGSDITPSGNGEPGPRSERQPAPVSPLEPADQRASAPDKSEVEAAIKLIREVFADDYKQAKKPAEKLALAEKLLAQSSESQSDTECYALLAEARSLAIAGDSPALAIQIIQQTGTRFEIDVTRQAVELVEQPAKDSLPPAVRKEMAEALLPLAETAIARTEYDIARRLLSAANQAARKTNDAALLRQIAARMAEVNDARKLLDAYSKAVDKLRDAPDDADGNLAVGRYLCFVKQDWDQGLPLLAKGSDQALKQIAGLELQIPSNPEEQVKIGDLWWAQFEQAKGKERADFADRCEKWYGAALPGLKGLSQTKVSKRLDELTAMHKTSVASTAADGAGRTSGAALPNKGLAPAHPPGNEKGHARPYSGDRQSPRHSFRRASAGRGGAGRIPLHAQRPGADARVAAAHLSDRQGIYRRHPAGRAAGRG